MKLTLRSRVVTMDRGPVQAAQVVVAARWTVRTTDPSPAKADTVPKPGTTLAFNLFADVAATGVVE